MDRAAKLAADARYFLIFEESRADKDEARVETRRRLSFLAGVYGYAQNEISAAVDRALTATGTTP